MTGDLPPDKWDDLDNLRRRLDAAPGDLELHFQIGETLFERGELKAAIPHLQQARHLGAREFRSCILLAHLFEKIGMLDLAAMMLQRADEIG